MNMKHPKVTGVIKAYKSLNRCKHAHMHPQLNVIPTDVITSKPHFHLCIHKNTLCNRHPLPIMQLLLLSLPASSEPSRFPVELTKQKKKLSAPLNSLHPNHLLTNREGTTGMPSATNLGQTEAKSARISHYTCFPSSLSPERTRERRRILRFPSIETVKLQTTQRSHFLHTPTALHSVRCERRDEAW